MYYLWILFQIDKRYCKIYTIKWKNWVKLRTLVRYLKLLCVLLHVCIYLVFKLDHRSAKYSLQVKSNLLPVFVKPLSQEFLKILLVAEKKKSNKLSIVLWKWCAIPIILSIKKALLEHSHAHLFTMIYGYFDAATAKWSCWNTGCRARKP